MTLDAAAMKKIVAEEAVNRYVKDGMNVGLGTGSTAYYAIKRIGELVAEGYDLTCVATSVQSEELAKESGIKVVGVDDVDKLDITIDGADEVDPKMQLIKGLGGALLREKIVAAATVREIIVADDSKLVEKLGTKAPLPVEVLIFGHEHTKCALERQGCKAELRMKDGKPFVTDGGNYIYDCRVEGIERYRISSIEPNLLSDEIIDWIASGSKIQPHFHIPLQVGCDEILEAMGRHYTTEFFKHKIDTLREKLGDGVFIGIDIMVGLPGETEELFEKTYAFLKEIHPAFLHIFPYSRRPGTPAAEMDGQVSEEVKKHRVAVLEELCAKLHEEFVESQKGKKALVLFESKEKDGKMGGYSGNYVRVSREYDPSLVGKIVEVTL